MNFEPLGDRVLVERIEENNTTLSGIIIPDSAKEKPLNAKVIAVSKDVEDVSVGDKVVFAKYSGNEITINSKEYLVMSVDDLLGILK